VKPRVQTLLGGAAAGRSRHAHRIPAGSIVSVCWRCPRRRRTLPISTCPSALITDRAMEAWYYPPLH